MDISRVLGIVYRYLWVMVLGALVAGLATYFALTRQPASYSASTDILVGPGLNNPSPDYNSLRIGGQLGQTYAQVLSSDSFLAAVNQKLQQKVDLVDLAAAITNRQSVDTRVLTIIVTYQDPKQAVAIANAAAQTLLEIGPSKNTLTGSLRAQMSDQSRQLEQTVSESQVKIQQLEAELAALQGANTSGSAAAISNEQLQAGSDYQSRIQQLEAELAALKAALPSHPEVYVEASRLNLQQQGIVQSELADERNRLQQQQTLVMSELADERNRLSSTLQSLASIYQILQVADSNQVEIMEPATVAVPVDQQLWIKVGASGVAGLIFGLIIAFVAGYFDDRLRLPGDLSKAAGVPLLSAVAKHTPLKGSGVERLVAFARPDSDAANRYGEAVAKLLFSIGEAMPSTLLLSSVGSKTGEDVAETAGNLAVAFAQVGHKVVLVDAQVGNPLLTTLFKAENKEGLTDLVAGKSREPQLVPVEQVAGIRFLPAGSSSENGSHAMLNPANVAALFERLQQEADIVLIAAPAMSRNAETLTLASQAKAVILVGRRGEARGKVVSGLVEDLRQMKIRPVGVMFDFNTSPSIPARGSRRSASEIGLERGSSDEAIAPGNLSEQTTES